MRRCLSVILSLAASVVLANPTGGTVASGEATIQQSANTLVITQTSANAIINWQSFSIGAGEVTSFVQPSSSSLVLNRVTGGSPSQLMGTLQSNGVVYVVNTSGVLLGAGAQVNTATFVATTRSISDASFLGGNPFAGAGTGTTFTVNGPFSVTSGVLNLGTTTVTSDALISTSAAQQLEVPDGGVLLFTGGPVLTIGAGTAASGEAVILSGGGATTTSGASTPGGTVTLNTTVNLSGGDVSVGTLTTTGGPVNAGAAVTLAGATAATPSVSPAASAPASPPVNVPAVPGSALPTALPHVLITLQKREPLY